MPLQMTSTDSRSQAALDAATKQINAVFSAAVGRVADKLGVSAQASMRIAERDLLITSQFQLRRNLSALLRTFADELSRRVSEELSTAVEPSRRPRTNPEWKTLTLVDATEMEERMFSDRIGHQISHACDAESRELAAYMGSLLQTGRPSQEGNPLRADVLGASIYHAIETVSTEPETRKLLARELGDAMAKVMPECYAQIIRDLQAQGWQPVELAVREVEGRGYPAPGVHSTGPSGLSGEIARGRSDSLDGLSSTGARGRNWHTDNLHTDSSGSLSGSTLSGGPSGPRGAASRFDGPASRPAHFPRGTLSAHQADAQLMALLRHLSAGTSPAGAFDTEPPGASGLGEWARTGSAGPAASVRSDASLLASSFDPVRDGAAQRSGASPFAADGLTGLMAVNLIRAHREELRQAADGKLDHMVIDVVGSLFDQILSDSRVPPQMARQIARLQLPVLRVALSDATFFSSRRHPVRRFVNRIASLACAFDDFGEGPGKQFLDRVRDLVQEIVEGDFDQIELYTSKLAVLEGFIAEQTHREAQQHGAAATLGAKELELRLQQRYMLQLQGALTPLALPGYLRDFLPQVWGQALVLAASRDGPDSERAKRYRRVARDLVMSIQPNGSPALRKKFLMQLPPLMRDLNEGLALIGWPPAAQRAFFAQLLPAHADSLKGAAQSELDHNLLAKQLEGIFNLPVPGTESLSAADPVPDVDAEVIAGRFSAEEAERVGLVTESAVDWSGTVDIDLSADIQAAADSGGSLATDSASLSDSAPLSLPGIAVDLDLSSSAEAAEPSRGAGLADHVKLGFAYQMHLKDEWQKVRLAHVSAGRGFFVFTRGRKHQETISMTSRMLARMCATGRLRAFESAYLIERATLRARKQLATLGAATRS